MSTLDLRIVSEKFPLFLAKQRLRIVIIDLEIHTLLQYTITRRNLSVKNFSLTVNASLGKEIFIIAAFFSILYFMIESLDSVHLRQPSNSSSSRHSRLFKCLGLSSSPIDAAAASVSRYSL
jgi:hypothetical protein